MTPVAHLRPEVGVDPREIALFIARDQPDAAARFLTASQQNFSDLAEMPGLGPVYGLKGPDLADIRFYLVSGFRNFLIFYRPTDYGVEILRVIHGSRNIPEPFGQSEH